MVSTSNLSRIGAVLIGLVVSCCWSAGANVIPTSAPLATETVVASPPPSSEHSPVPATTLGPIAHPLPTTAAPELPKEHAAGGNHHVAPAAVLPTTPAPVAHSTVAPAIKEPILTTLAPSAAANMSIVKIHSTVLPTIAPIIHNNGSKEVCTGFCDYIKPICDSLDKISVKQLFKIQSQFKQFVQKVSQ